MHDSEQEHSGITGCRVTYESTIFYNEANKFSIIVVKTNDPRIPLQACSDRYYGDRMLRFTAVGYELPRTKAVELELDGEWVESKYGYQLQVEQWQEIVPQTADGLLAYLGSGLIKGIGPKTAEDIVATFGPDTLNILDNEPEKLLQIRGITEGKLKDIEESYAESRVLRNLMSLLGPFKMQVSTYLRVYRRYPKLIEHLVKVGFEHIVADIVYRHGMGSEIDDTQKRTHRILRVNKEDLTMLRELNAGIDTLRAYQQYTKLNLRSRQELLQWQLKNHVHTVPTQWFAYMTARKFMRYMDSQLPDYMQLKRAFLYRSPMEEAISTYSDYLQMCQEQNYDMKSSQVLFPKHCNEAHDELSRYIKKCRDEQTKRAFREVYEHLAEKANLTSKKLQIVCPKQTDDLIAEGQALHHCVGTYIERVAAKKCLIVFVRRVEEPKKPYVTVEVRNGKIEQIHGDHNSDPTEEVKKFVDLWSRKVLPMALQAA